MLSSFFFRLVHDIPPSNHPPQLFHTWPNSTFGSVFFLWFLALKFLASLFLFSSLSRVLSTVETSCTKTPKKMNNTPWQLRVSCLGSYFWANSIPPFFLFFFFFFFFFFFCIMHRSSRSHSSHVFPLSVTFLSSPPTQTLLLTLPSFLFPYFMTPSFQIPPPHFFSPPFFLFFFLFFFSLSLLFSLPSPDPSGRLVSASISVLDDRIVILLWPWSNILLSAWFKLIRVKLGCDFKG